MSTMNRLFPDIYLSYASFEISMCYSDLISQTIKDKTFGGSRNCIISRLKPSMRPIQRLRKELLAHGIEDILRKSSKQDQRNNQE